MIAPENGLGYRTPAQAFLGGNVQVPWIPQVLRLLVEFRKLTLPPSYHAGGYLWRKNITTGF